MKFDVKTDIDTDTWVKESKHEAKEIFNGNGAHGRSFKKVFTDTLRGKAAERFLIERCGYSNNPNRYQDLISPTGNTVEVKVTNIPGGVTKKIEKCMKAKLEGWLESDYLYVFLNYDKSTDYVLFDTYKWYPDDGMYMAEKIDHQAEIDKAKEYRKDVEWLHNY